MTKVLFVCLGNICRSPMGEMIFKQLVKEAGLEDKYEIRSAGTSSEETGNDIYPPAKKKLTEKGVPFTRHSARQVTLTDLSYYDCIVCMDKENLSSLKRKWDGQYEEKLHMLMSFCGENKEVADPWFTGDFEEAYQDIIRGCKALLKYFEE